MTNMTTSVYLFAVLTALTLCVAPARADSILLVLDTPHQAGLTGDTIQYFGTITNNTAGIVYLNGDDINLIEAPGSFIISDAAFYTNTPAGYLYPGASTGDIGLFDLTPSNPPVNILSTSYSGTFSLFGGSDSSASDLLAQVSFSATTAPEPGSSALLLAAVVVIVRFGQHCSSSRTRKALCKRSPEGIDE